MTEPPFEPEPCVRVYLNDVFLPDAYPCGGGWTKKGDGPWIRYECDGPVVQIGDARGEGFGLSFEFQCGKCGGFTTVDWIRQEPDGRFSGEISRRDYERGVARGGDPTKLARIGDPLEGAIRVVPRKRDQ